MRRQNPVVSRDAGTNAYKDIIDWNYPLENGHFLHPKMTIADRAKIFAPFAALKGYEDAIREKQKLVVPKVELSEELAEMIDRQLAFLSNELADGRHPMARVVYFVQDEEDENGNGQYLQVTGVVAGLFPEARYLQVVGKKISIDDIRELEVCTEQLVP